MRTPAELAYVSHRDVQALVPIDIFDRTEDDALRSYDSRTASPLLVFLGIDESREDDGMSFSEYKGAPHFALDVTPKGPYEKECRGIVETMEAQGLEFHQARVITAVSPDEGMSNIIPQLHFDIDIYQTS